MEPSLFKKTWACDKNVKTYYPPPSNSSLPFFHRKKGGGTKRGGFENHGYAPSYKFVAEPKDFMRDWNSSVRVKPVWACTDFYIDRDTQLESVHHLFLHKLFQVLQLIPRRFEHKLVMHLQYHI